MEIRVTVELEDVHGSKSAVVLVGSYGTGPNGESEQEKVIATAVNAARRALAAADLGAAPVQAEGEGP